MTWPLAARLDRSLGGRAFPFDQYLLMYVLEWGRHVLPAHPARFFDAGLCYPARGMLGTVEHLLGLWPLYALVRHVLADPISAYHLLGLIVCTLSALAMALLVLRWTGDALAAAVAGSIYAFAPLRLTYWPWLHVLVTFCLPLLLLAVERVLWGNAVCGVLLLALLAVLQVLLTVYGTAHAALTVVVFTAAYLIGLGRPRPWRRVLLLPLAAVATLPPLLVLFDVYGSAVALPGLGATLVRQAASVFWLDPLASLPQLGVRLARVTGLVPQAPTPARAVPPPPAPRRAPGARPRGNRHLGAPPRRPPAGTGQGARPRRARRGRSRAGRGTGIRAGSVRRDSAAARMALGASRLPRAPLPGALRHGRPGRAGGRCRGRIRARLPGAVAGRALCGSGDRPGPPPLGRRPVPVASRASARRAVGSRAHPRGARWRCSGSRLASAAASR